MQFIIGIVPPLDYLSRIVEFQRRWESNRLPDLIEPHITVKSQAGLGRSMEWEGPVKEVCGRHRSFMVTLSRPGIFAKSVGYISVKSEGLVELHRKLVRAVSPDPESSVKYFELDSYMPHLTLGGTKFGLTEEDVINMVERAGKELAPFPTFRAHFLRVYGTTDGGNYQRLFDMKLA